jgi:hypothetical protein
LVTEIDMTPDWGSWSASPPRVFLKPETGYEGVALPIIPSQVGSSPKPENGLRDPAIYREGDHVYLLYSVEGERGIAIAELHKRRGAVR